MEYSFVIAIIPVILVVAFIVWIAKRITEGERLDMKEATLGVVILLVAVLIMVPMVSSTQTYTWNEDAGELTIKKNVFGGYYAWDEYADDVRSLVIEDGVTVEAGAFDTLTSLESVSIGKNAEVSQGAFSVSFMDPYGAAISESELSDAEYDGFGDGTLYLYDPGLFKYYTGIVRGFADGVTGVKYVVIPDTYDGAPITKMNDSAFLNDTTIEHVLFKKGATLTESGGSVFSGCTSLTKIRLPVVPEIGSSFCKSAPIVDLVIPEGVQSIRANTFNGFRSESLVMPSSMRTISGSSFSNNPDLSELVLPSGITSIGSGTFASDTGITAVVFASGFSATLDSNWCPWTFYAADGTTTLDKLDASALAGKTFQGIASALVEVAPGQLTLTPQQIQQVHLHDTELQDLKDQISIDPLPLQPSLQEQELTA